MRAGGLVVVLCVGTSCLQASSCARQTAPPDARFAPSAPPVRVVEGEPVRHDGERDAQVSAPEPPAHPVARPLADGGTPSESVCRGFLPGGRAPASPAAHCAGPATDHVTGARDSAALRKIDEVINDQFLSVHFDQDLALLLGTSAACEARCSAPVQAKIWMYVGLVYGSGRQSLEDARCAFEVALAWDPGVVFDEALATPAVKSAFATARESVCGPARP